MITGFEDYTADLSEHELKHFVPNFIKQLSNKIGEKNAVTSSQIKKGYSTIGVKIEGPRIRKIINYIRCRNLVPGLIASSKGYYVATNKQDLDRYIKSLNERIASIQQVRKKTIEYYNTL